MNPGKRHEFANSIEASYKSEENQKSTISGNTGVNKGEERFAESNAAH